MRQILRFFLLSGLFFIVSCVDDPYGVGTEPKIPECAYNDQETISFINFGLKVPEYTGTYFDNVYMLNYSSDRIITFLTQVLETRGNYTPDNVAHAKIRFITDGEDCVGSETFSFKAGDSEIGGSSILAPAPSTSFTGDVQITIRTDAFRGEYDSEAFTVTWTKRAPSHTNILEGTLIGQKMPYRSSDQSILISQPIYGEPLN